MPRTEWPGPSLLGLVLLVGACKSGADAPGTRAPPRPVKTGDAASAPLDAAPATSAVTVVDADPSAPRATRSEVKFSPPWVVLGQSLVDARSGLRVRTLPFGEIAIAGDGQHFALFDGRDVVLGAVNDERLDYTIAVDLDGLYHLSLAANGSAAVVTDRAGATHLIDVRSRTHLVLARPPADAGAETWQQPRHVLSADGRLVTWVDEHTAYVRELDGGRTRDVRAGGKAAVRSEIAGDTLVALFDDELVVLRLSTGTELARPHHADDFVLADDGKTVAWQDAAAPLQTVVLFDAEHAREGRHVAIEDDPTSTATPRYRGACGGGRFSLAPPSRIDGDLLFVERGCSLIDDVTVNLASGTPLPIRSATPYDDYLDEQRRLAVCARAHVRCPERTDLAWVGSRRSVMADGSGKLGIFDAASGRRIALLADADDTSMDHDFAVAPDGKTIAAIDRTAIARLWDGATGKLLWSAPSALQVSAPRR